MFEPNFVPTDVSDKDREGFSSCPFCGKPPVLYDYVERFHDLGELNITCHPCRLSMSRRYRLGEGKERTDRPKLLKYLRQAWNRRDGGAPSKKTTPKKTTR